MSHATTLGGIAELGLMTGAADPMMRFPAGTIFTPYSVVRNVSNNPIPVTSTLWWMQGGAAASFPLPQFTLLPQETRSLDMPTLLAAAGLTNFSGSVDLVFDTHGQSGVLMAAGSVDQTNTYVFEIAPRGIVPSAGKSLSYWSTANGDDTMVNLWNPADEAQDFTFRIDFSGGHYLLPIHLEARAARTLSMSQIIQMQVPDAEENIIPASIQTGSAKLVGSQADNQDILVVMDSGTYNVIKATCGEECLECDGAVSYFIVVLPESVAVNQNQQEYMEAQWNTGSQYDGTSQTTWTSSDHGIATVNVGLVHGVAVGHFTIGGSDPTMPNYTPYTCFGGFAPGCPIARGGGGGGGGVVTPQIKTINPTWGQVGTNVPVTITGQGFGSSPTVSAGGGIQVTVLPGGGDTTVSATLAIPANATTGPQPVRVTNTTEVDGGSSTSDPVAFDVTTAIPLPNNFTQTNVQAIGGGVLKFTYSWGSSSGNTADLGACTVREYVAYPGGNPFVWPSPPYQSGQTSPNPTVGDAQNPPSPGINGGLFDFQEHPGFLKPYVNNTYSDTQKFQYSCTNSQNGAWVDFFGPYSIARTVGKNANQVWVYTVTKNGSSASVNLP